MPLMPEEEKAIVELFDEVSEVVGEATVDRDYDARDVLRDTFDTDTTGVQALDEPVTIHCEDRHDLAKLPMPYDTVYGIDGSTTRPESFANGLVVDVANAKAAMLGDGDEDIERESTIVGAYHITDDTVEMAEKTLRQDNITSKLVSIEPTAARSIRDQVSTTARTLAEGHHAERIAPRLDGPLFLDGAIYPLSVRSTLLFAKREVVRGEADLTHTTGKQREQDIVDAYVHAIDSQRENGYPVIGVVKAMSTDMLVSAAEENLLRQHEEVNLPWTRDDQLLADALYVPGPDDVTFTSWFVEGALGDADGTQVEPLMGFDVAGDPKEYRRAFFYVRLPTTKTVFRIEAPLMMARTEDTRNKLQQMVLRLLVESGDTPAVVKRADNRANISQDNSKGLKRRLLREMKKVYGYNRDGRFEDIMHEQEAHNNGGDS